MLDVISEMIQRTEEMPVFDSLEKHLELIDTFLEGKPQEEREKLYRRICKIYHQLTEKYPSLACLYAIID